MDEDTEKDIIYLGPRGHTIINYIIVNAKESEREGNIEVKVKIESDHLPMIYSEKNQKEEEYEKIKKKK